MRVDLGNLQGIDTELQLPAAEGEPPKRLRLERLTKLSGVLERRGGTLRLDGVSAGAVQLAEARWQFGRVELSSPQPCALEEVALELHLKAQQPLGLALTAGKVHFAWLSIDVGDTHVAGVAQLEGASLRQEEGLGTVFAEVATLRDLQVTLGALSFTVPELSITGLEVGWGAPVGFHMSARTAKAAQVEVAHTRLSLSASEVDLRGFEVGHGSVDALSLDAASVRGELELPAPPTGDRERDAATPTPARPAFDLALLDALEGQLVADAQLELRLPAGLHRSLHIPLSLDIFDGSIDYQALEHSLPRLEDSLLDFSRKDDWLVLELGLPLLSTRGRGKSLLRWPLPTDTPAHRVRLSTLPRYERPEGRASERPGRPSRPPSSRTSGAVGLERAQVTLGPMRLRLPPPSRHLEAGLRMLCFEGATLEGSLCHAAGEPVPGHASVEVDALEAHLERMPTGPKTLDLRLMAERIRPLRVHTLGLRPTGLSFEAEAVRLKAAKYG